ncbi:MAG TPA: heme-binding beta-barrel domain-containing protein [Acidimicrobiales bacterium]|jgi:hypothetical protein
MPIPTPDQLGPLAPFAGEWEGDQGLDVSFNHETDQIRETPYREKATLAPFGPVDNGDQHLFGLDYRMAAFKEGEDEPFHTEVGYWLYDPASGEVQRIVMVPRSTVVLSTGIVQPGTSTFTLESKAGSDTNGILENTYLKERAHTSAFSITFTVASDEEFSYEETISVDVTETGPMAHTDRNTLKRTKSLWA